MKYLLLIGSLRIIFVISVSYPGNSYCCACTHRDFSPLVYPAPPQTPGEISCSCDGYWYIWIIWLFTFYEKYWSIVTLQCYVSFCCYSQWVILFSGKLLIEEPQAVEGMLLFSLWVMSNSLQPRGLKHARLPCPSLFPGVGSHSCPLTHWCYVSVSPSVVPFSFCLQSFLALGSFPMSWLFATGGKSIAPWISVLPMNIQGWFPLGVTGLISLQSKGFSRAPQFKNINSLALSFLYGPPLTSIHDYWKNIALIKWTFVGKMMSLLFNSLSRFVIAFLPRSN